MNNAGYWIQHLGLKKHPEGGWFNEFYRSGESIPAAAVPERYTGGRSFSTSIYFLIESDDISAFHRIQSDEIWHFYTGSPVTIHCINAQGYYYWKKLGGNPENNEEFQVLIPRNTWFGALVNRPLSFSLMGCTVAPGFEFSDFKLGVRDELIRLYPEQKKSLKG